ncbi:hypothetical protein BofuT4_uP137740.1 [Botrytis cinerea T4]|uniref:Secreted protein n=1 Tax=Botryotinia fuckeliana (strain T4) TaxID=999810 RepID=G2YMK2_BOTF4|nr:hypothetical protein BofuT4_uP137740.1 [Botrytis cinerea T4]
MLLVRFSGLSFGGLLTIRCRMDMVCPETHNGAQMWGYRHRSGTTEQIGHAEEAAFENLGSNANSSSSRYTGRNRM